MKIALLPNTRVAKRFIHTCRFDIKMFFCFYESRNILQLNNNNIAFIPDDSVDSDDSDDSVDSVDSDDSD